MQYFFRQHPLIKVLIPLLAGITAQRFLFQGLVSWALIPVLALAFFMIILSFIKTEKAILIEYLTLIDSFLLFFFLGMHLFYLQNDSHYKSHFTHQGEIEAFVAELDQTIGETDKTFKTTVHIQAIKTDSAWQEANGKILIYFLKDSLSAKPELGNIVLIRAHPQQIDPPKNPYAFHYKNHLADRNVFRMTFVREGQWEIVGQLGFSIGMLAQKTRSKLLQILKNHGVSGNEYAVSAAILLGYDDDLDDETRAQFSGSGAMHILCVSGLHVGIIFLVSSWLLGFLKRFRQGRFIRPGLLLLLVWAYAFITGLSPSVMRASLMISFIIIGQSRKKQGSVFQSIIASALILIIFNPLIIFQLGFQLSYAAVIAIVVLQKPIYQLVSFNHTIPDKIWEITTVSVAAQIGTFPIASFYFHQFPVYFLITNILIIPFSAFIIYAGILFLITSAIPFVSGISTYILTALISVLNSITKHISQLPGAVIDKISISPLQFSLLILLVILFSFAILQKNRSSFVLSLMLLLLLGATEVTYSYNHSKQSEFTVFYAGKSLIIEVIRGHNAAILTDSASLNDSKNLDFAIKAYNIQKRIRSIESYALENDFQCSVLGIEKKGDYVQIQDKLLYLAPKKPDYRDSLRAPLDIDFLLIQSYPYKPISNFLCFYEPKTVLSIRNSYLNGENLNINSWILEEQGAYQITLNR